MKLPFSGRHFVIALTIGVLLTAVVATPATGAAPAGSAPVSSTLVNLGRALLFQGWMSSPDRYERMQSPVVLSPGKSQLRASTCNFTTGGAPIPLGVNSTLSLTLDGTTVATASVKAADVTVTFNVDLTSIAEGWHMASVTGLDSSWSVLDYGVYVLKGARAQPHSQMPVTTASHELIFEGAGRYQQAWVPTKFEPVTVPYPPRQFPDLATVPTRKDVVITSLAVPRPGDLYRPALTKEGVWTTANRENYFYFDFEQPTPILPMLDGPRGRGSIIAPVHLEVGSAAPNGTLRGNVYFIESWRIGKVTPDGTVVTLAGYRHKDIASYWNDPTSAELVGDWSSIPPERRGFAQPWGMAWDPRTLVINEQAAPILSENNEKPHVLGPTLYVSDTYRNRVLKIAYSATAHGIPPKITEFVTGLNEPWDVIPVGTRLYVSDRKNWAIKVFDMDTAALVKTIPVVQPEGMALLDGWLYYSSIKTKSIRKINLASGQDVLIADPTVAGSSMGYFINDNSRYMKIAVSDGSFGPRGMIAYTTWSNSYYGYPNLIDGATGKHIDWLQANNGDTVKGTSPLGLSSYASAVGIGHGRMLFGTAEEGLHVVSKALDTDPVIDAAQYKVGMDQWQARGYGLTHGPGGYGFYGLPLPWGATPQIDYFLRANLHGSGLPARAIEYYNASFDHYFITPDLTEISLLDAHAPPFQEWSRTGFSFNTYVNFTAPAGSVAICRFFNSSFVPKSSHFYAAHGFGCEDTLRLFPGWGLEDDKSFNTMLPDAMGTCPAETIPVYRFYNNGIGGAPNHRYATESSVRDEMLLKGWIPEGAGNLGVIMCAPQ